MPSGACGCRMLVHSGWQMRKSGDSVGGANQSFPPSICFSIDILNTRATLVLFRILSILTLSCRLFVVELQRSGLHQQVFCCLG